MCWKYEEEYEPCFDLIFEDGLGYVDRGLNSFMKDLGVKINKHLEFENAFFNFLSYCHENKIIEPDNEQ